MFKNTYTRGGKRFSTRNWCIKLQHQGRRKTVSLQGRNRAQAAAEAGRVYRAILAGSWSQAPGAAVDEPGLVGAAGGGERASFLAQRLLVREYPMGLRPKRRGELSVHVEHEGKSAFFPLGTDKRRKATPRALRIYRTLGSEGWAGVCKKFSREMTVGFRWSDRPLAWTYTTIHTQPHPAGSLGIGLPPARASLRRVIIVEPDDAIRRALEWCVNHMEEYSCSGGFATMAAALEYLRRHPTDVALVSSQVTERPAAVCLNELQAAVPAVFGLLYSVFEDSEELFRRTPGGATNYLLQRTAATGFLQPLAASWQGARPSREEATRMVWHYFKNVFAAPPAAGLPRDLGHLTHREHEVIALLSNGSTDKEIAERLDISIYTVREHMSNVFEKLGVHNRTGAVARFLQK